MVRECPFALFLREHGVDINQLLWVDTDVIFKQCQYLKDYKEPKAVIYGEGLGDGGVARFFPATED